MFKPIDWEAPGTLLNYGNHLLRVHGKRYLINDAPRGGADIQG